MARSGRYSGLGGNVGFSDFVMDTGKPAVRAFKRVVDRNYVSGGSRTVLDPLVFVSVDSEEDEDGRPLQSGGADIESAVYEYSSEKSGAAGTALSAVCPADPSDSRTPGFFFSLRAYLRFFRVGRCLLPGVSPAESVAAGSMSADSGRPDRFFKIISGRSFPHGCAGRLPGRMRRRDRGILLFKRTCLRTQTLPNMKVDCSHILENYIFL